MNYTLENFLSDFKALAEVRALAKEERPQEYWDQVAEHVFQRQYQQAGTLFLTLHREVVRVLEEYVSNHRPGLRNRPHLPENLLSAIFCLVAEQGIARPTQAKIEEVEAVWSERN